MLPPPLISFLRARICFCCVAPTLILLFVTRRETFFVAASGLTFFVEGKRMRQEQKTF